MLSSMKSSTSLLSTSRFIRGSAVLSSSLSFSLVISDSPKSNMPLLSIGGSFVKAFFDSDLSIVLKIESAPKAVFGTLTGFLKGGLTLLALMLANP